MNKNIVIRPVKLSDASRLLEIYGYYVENTAISFEYEVPSVSAFVDRITSIQKNYPYIVLEVNNIAVGYAYANYFKTRPAYSRSCELSIYVDKNERGKGYGKILYEALESELANLGFLNVYACITDPVVEDEFLTKASQRFHGAMGFEKVAEFHMCGYKFSRWYNMVCMEKIIGPHN